MSGTSSSTQQTQQQSQTNPWAPTMPALNNFLGTITNQLTPMAQPNAATQQAFQTIQQNAGNTPDFSQQANAYAGNLIGGGANYAPVVQDAYKGLQSTLAPYTQPGFLDPTQAPGMQNVLDTIRSDVTNNVNGMFAGAGRDLSGMNQQTLARGIAQGEAQPLLNQYNANVAAQQGAAGTLYNAGMGTAGALSQLQQTGLGNQAAGFNFLTQGLPQAANAGAYNTIAAGQMPFQYGAQNMGMLENLTVPIAGLGGQSTGTSNTQGTQTMSPFQMAMMGLQVGSRFLPGAWTGGK